MKKPPLRIVIAGHVDHGKSTLIGRLLHETDSLPIGKREELEEICKRRGTEALEWSFVMDAFQAERDQAITIDTAQIRFSTPNRDFVMIDAPGHKEFLKNMISGASMADAALLIVDATEGMREQTKRHAYMLSLLGLKQIAVAVNKMDAVDYNETAYQNLSKDIKDYLRSIDLKASHIIPLSARHGDMILNRNHMNWYEGKTLIEVFESFKSIKNSSKLPLRFPVQDVYRFNETRILCGRVESGSLSKGDKILFSPSNEEATITSIETWPDKNKNTAKAGESIGITLDRPIFIERGEIASHKEHAPMLSDVFRAKIFWLASKSLQVGNSYKIRYGTFETPVTVQSIERLVDTENLSEAENAAEIPCYAAGEITLRTRELIPLDGYSENTQTGRLVIFDGYDIAGGGHILMEGYPDQRQSVHPKSENITKVRHYLTSDARAHVKGHQGGIFWLTGLSGSGKSTLAMALERALHEKGYHAYVLDGDNIRHGLNADLGFAPQDRAENIRRVSEVAALMADAGLIVVTAFISPYRADRDKARRAAPEIFHEIHIKADLQTCESRDPKGLYKKARAGEIEDFTGVGSPYEEPVHPDLVIDTQRNNLAVCGGQVLEYIEQHVTLKETLPAYDITRQLAAI